MIIGTKMVNLSLKKTLQIAHSTAGFLVESLLLDLFCSDKMSHSALLTTERLINRAATNATCVTQRC